MRINNKNIIKSFLLLKISKVKIGIKIIEDIWVKIDNKYIIIDILGLFLNINSNENIIKVRDKDIFMDSTNIDINYLNNTLEQ